MRRFAVENSLSLFFLGIFLVTLVGQTFAGQHAYNEERAVHGSEPISYGRYLLSSEFGQALLENWQSEWLQFVLFTMATIWFVQKGSNESKPLDSIGLESDEKQKVRDHAKKRSPGWAKRRDWRLHVYSSSYLIVMAVIFLSSWFAQSVTGWTQFNEAQVDHDEPAVSWARYLTKPVFWENTLQNWQSEFLAVGTMVVFTIYLRQRGSPESKPVGAPHDETASSG